MHSDEHSKRVYLNAIARELISDKALVKRRARETTKILLWNKIRQILLVKI